MKRISQIDGDEIRSDRTQTHTQRMIWMVADDQGIPYTYICRYSQMADTSNAIGKEVKHHNGSAVENKPSLVTFGVFSEFISRVPLCNSGT